jgi:hypothetical protein
VRTRNAQALGRFVTGALIRKSGLALAALSLLLLLGAGAALDTAPARASDSETAALIGYFNQYRTSHGVTALATNASENSDAQAAADESAQDPCGFRLPTGHNLTWSAYGFGTASQVWAAYEGPPPDGILSYIGDSKYHSAGVGRTKSSQGCGLGYIWVMILDKGGGGSTATPTHTATATVTPFPTATPTGSESPTATASETPIVTPFPTQSPPGTPTPTPSPAPLPEIAGDVTCGGIIDLADVLLLLEAAAHVGTGTACLHPPGIDCTGGVDAADVLLLLEYLEGIEYFLPDGCPALGSTPTPTPSPTIPPSVTPTPSPSPLPVGINHCELSIVAFHMATAQSLRGDTHCTPGAGTEYDCAFSDDGLSVTCTASTDDFPDYTCWFLEQFGDCVPDSGQPEYQCFDDGQNPIECLPTHTGYAAYECGVDGETVSCTAETPFPDFICRHQGVEFTCIGQADTTPAPTPS